MCKLHVLMKPLKFISKLVLMENLEHIDKMRIIVNKLDYKYTILIIFYKFRIIVPKYNQMEILLYGL